MFGYAKKGDCPTKFSDPAASAASFRAAGWQASVGATIFPARHPRRLLRRQSGTTRQAPRCLHRPDLHRSTIQQQPQLRSLLGRNQGKASLRRPPRLHRCLHRLHAKIAARNSPASPRPRVLKKTGSFHYHCEEHAAAYVKVMLDRVHPRCTIVFEVEHDSKLD